MITTAEVQAALRLSSTAVTDEIEDTIAAAKLDMARVGINVSASDGADDDLTDLLIKLFCKWHLNFNEKGEQYKKNYEALRDALSMSSDYRQQEEEA